MTILEIIFNILNSSIMQGLLTATEIINLISDFNKSTSKKSLEAEALYCYDKSLFHFCGYYKIEYDSTAMWETLILDFEQLQKLNFVELQDIILKTAIGVDYLTDTQKNYWHYCIDKVISEDSLNILNTFLNRQYQRESLNLPPRIFTELAPLPPTKQYVGREEEQSRIMKKLIQKKKLILINGLGGVGKSTVCKDLFYELKNKQSIQLAWVNYNGTDLFEDFVNQFYYPELCKDRREKLKFFLQNEIDDDAIIFVDNLNAREIDDDFIIDLAKSKCNVICTSRITNYEYFDTVPINLFDLDKCISLFKNYAEIPTNDYSSDIYIADIVERVARHTLTLEILGKITVAESLVPKQILNKLEKEGINLSGIVEHQLTENSLAGHLCKIFPIDKLTKEQKYILAHFALCPYEQIPKEIKNWIDIPGHGTHNLRYLIKYGWFVENEQSYYMHPIIKEVVRRISEISFEDYSILINSLENLTHYSRNKNASSRLIFYPYVKTVLDKISYKIKPEIAQLYFNLATIEKETNNYTASINNYTIALNIWQNPVMLEYKSLIYINTRIASILYQIGANYYELDDCINARIWYDKISQMKGSYKDDELSAQIYNNYALTYQKEYFNANVEKLKASEIKRKLNIALKFFNRTITEFQKLKKQDVNMSIAYRNIGYLYLNLKCYNLAVFYINKSQEICLKKAESHHTTLERNYYYLACVFDELGNTLPSQLEKCVKYRIALHYYRKCHAITVNNAKINISYIDIEELEEKLKLCLEKIQNMTIYKY